METVVGFEAIKCFSTNLAMLLKDKVWGNVTVHYNPTLDSLDIIIKNRALYAEPFRYSYPRFSDEMRHGTSSGVICAFLLGEYREYINRYFWR